MNRRSVLEAQKRAALRHLLLPPDSYGNRTVSTYDNNQMCQFLLRTVLEIKIERIATRPQKTALSIVAPRRIINLWKLTNVIQIVRLAPGIRFESQDKLIGLGRSGADLVVIKIGNTAAVSISMKFQ